LLLGWVSYVMVPKATKNDHDGQEREDNRLHPALHGSLCLALEALQAAAAPAAVLAYHALAAGLAEPAFRWSLAAGDEAMRVVAVRDAITFYEQTRHLLAEQLLEATLPAPEIEHLYTHLGRAYELNAEWEQARATYTALL